MKNNKWKVGIYARVSTDNDNQKTSNDGQLSMMEEWISSQKDMSIVDTYVDDGVSGTTIDKRLSFQRMIKDAKSGKINMIVVRSVTRFARNQVDSIELAQELKERGVKIYFFQEGIDTFEDSKMLGLWSWLSENESRNTSQRRKDGGRQRQLKGMFTTNRPPLGYTSTNGHLKINEEEAIIIRLIFDKYVEGKGFVKIADELNSLGYATRRGFPFRGDKIKYILLNETYKGTFIGNRYTKADMLSKKIIERPREEWIIIDDNHEAIIDTEKFELVQKLYKDKSFTLGKRSRALLAGVIKCGKCGHNFNRHVNKRDRNGKKWEIVYYRCAGRYGKGTHFCNAKPIREDVLVEALNSELGFLKLNQKTLIKIKEDVLKKIEKKMNSIDSELVDIENRIKEVEQERMQLARKNLKGKIPDDLYEELEIELSTELKGLNAKKNKTTLIDSRKIFEKRYDEFIEVITDFKKVENLSNTEVRKLIENITIDEQDIVIQIKIDKDDFELQESLIVDPVINITGLNSDVKSSNFTPIVSTIGSKLHQNNITLQLKIG